MNDKKFEYTDHLVETLEFTNKKVVLEQETLNKLEKSFN